MNEEENQAFKALHFYNSEDYGTEELKKYIKIIVNLIEKQQQEIEHLTEINNKYNDMKYFAMVADRYISKDIIKAKIEEYNKECDECNFNKSGICKELKAYNCCTIQSVLELLNELLGETK